MTQRPLTSTDPTGASSAGQPSGKAWRTPALIGLVALAIVVGAAAALGLLSGSPESATASASASPSAAPAATESAAASVNAVPSANPSLGETPADSSREPSATPGAWSEVARFGRDATFTSATGAAYANGVYVVSGVSRVAMEVGYAPAGDRLWRSTDGTSWAEIPLPTSLAEARIISIVAAPDDSFLLYAMRYDDEGGSAGIVMGSTDGATWRQVESTLPDDLFVGTVVRGARGFAFLAPQTADSAPAIWFSTDGLAWEPTHEFSQAIEWVQVSDVAAGDEGFVAFGVRIDPADDSWTRFSFASADGREWFESREPLGTEPFDYRPDVFVSSHGPDWLAASAERDDSARFWWSADGLSWEEVSRISEVGTRMQWSPVLMEAGNELFFGQAPIDDPSVLFPRIWRSPDGITWADLKLASRFAIGAVVAGPDRLIVAGTAGSYSSSRVVIWVGH